MAALVFTDTSLAGVVGRKAGTATGFGRYSEAPKKAGLTWNEQHLDARLKNPGALVPANAMGFPGIADDSARSDLIAYLEAAPAGSVKPPGRSLPKMKEAGAAARVTAISHSGDAYRVSTADGKTRSFWELNLRFKTDGSADGPAAGHPVLVSNGRQGDRASVIFSRLDEISTFVRNRKT